MVDTEDDPNEPDADADDDLDDFEALLDELSADDEDPDDAIPAGWKHPT